MLVVPAGEFREHHQNQGLRQPGKLCLDVARSKAFGLFSDGEHVGGPYQSKSLEGIRHLDVNTVFGASAALQWLDFLLRTSPFRLSFSTCLCSSVVTLY
jgi:hypothetical protein